MYDPTIGRWMSEDPLGLGPDDNPYRYVKNDPVNATDPTGEYVVAKDKGTADQWALYLRRVYGVDPRPLPLADGSYYLQVSPEDRAKIEEMQKSESAVNRQVAYALLHRDYPVAVSNYSENGRYYWSSDPRQNNGINAAQKAGVQRYQGAEQREQKPREQGAAKAASGGTGSRAGWTWHVVNSNYYPNGNNPVYVRGPDGSLRPADAATAQAVNGARSERPTPGSYHRQTIQNSNRPPIYTVYGPAGTFAWDYEQRAWVQVPTSGSGGGKSRYPDTIFIDPTSPREVQDFIRGLRDGAGGAFLNDVKGLIGLVQFLLQANLEDLRQIPHAIVGKIKSLLGPGALEALQYWVASLADEYLQGSPYVKGTMIGSALYFIATLVGGEALASDFAKARALLKEKLIKSGLSADKAEAAILRLEAKVTLQGGGARWRSLEKLPQEVRASGAKLAEELGVERLPKGTGKSVKKALSNEDLLALSETQRREFAQTVYGESGRVYRGEATGVESRAGPGATRSVHTHPGDRFLAPSPADLESSINSGLPIEIVGRDYSTGKAVSITFNKKESQELAKLLRDAENPLKSQPKAYREYWRRVFEKYKEAGIQLPPKLAEIQRQLGLG